VCDRAKSGTSDIPHEAGTLLDQRVPEESTARSVDQISDIKCPTATSRAILVREGCAGPHIKTGSPMF
jgi:UDP-N-acetylglucosamine 2-epimerase